MKEVEAEPSAGRASIDRFEISPDEGGGVVDLRPIGAGEDPELRQLMVGRAAKLARLLSPIKSIRRNRR